MTTLFLILPHIRLLYIRFLLYLASKFQYYCRLMHIPPAFDCRFHHCEVGRPSTALVPVADFVFLEGVEDLVEAVVGGEQDLGLHSRLFHEEEICSVDQMIQIRKCNHSTAGGTRSVIEVLFIFFKISSCKFFLAWLQSSSSMANQPVELSGKFFNQTLRLT